MGKIVFNYHPVTGEYLGEVQADESPLEPGEYLIPAFATTKIPPASGAREVAVFNVGDDDWVIAPDYRAVPLYSTVDGSEVTVTGIGAQPDNTTELRRLSSYHDWDGTAWVLSIQKARDATWILIKDERDRRSEAGCYVDGNWFHNDLKSRTQWERMANRAAALVDADPYLVDGEQVAWKTMSGAFIPLTAGLIRQVVDAFEVQEVVTFKAAEIHRAAVNAADDPASYDYLDGWPEVYQAF